MPGFDSLFYFQPLFENLSELGVETPIVKIYPDAEYPPWNHPDSVPPELRSVYLTEDGYFKYWEYEYITTDLLPETEYWAAVTVFDYGSPISGIASLESKKRLQSVITEPELACCGLYTGGETGNTDCDIEGKRTLSDITTLIANIYITHIPLCCTANGNVDGDLEGKLTLNDIVGLIDNIYINHVACAPCL